MIKTCVVVVDLVMVKGSSYFMNNILHTKLKTIKERKRDTIMALGHCLDAQRSMLNGQCPTLNHCLHKTGSVYLSVYRVFDTQNKTQKSSSLCSTNSSSIIVMKTVSFFVYNKTVRAKPRMKHTEPMEIEEVAVVVEVGRERVRKKEKTVKTA